MWYKIKLSLDQVSSGIEISVHEEFNKVFKALSDPEGIALFATNSYKLINEKYLEMYFSPDAVKLCKHIIDEYHGTECDKPAKKGLYLVMGFADAWNLLD